MKSDKIGEQSGGNYVYRDGRQAAFFTIPMPPSSNNIFANRHGGGRHVTEAYEAWRRDAGWTLKLQKIKPFAGPVKVEIRCERPKQRADIDNRIKPVLDLMTMMQVIDDDVQVVDVRARWWPMRGARVIIEQARPFEQKHAEMETHPDSVQRYFDAARRKEQG